MKTPLILFAAALLGLAAGCRAWAATTEAPPASPLDGIAESYVRLVLAIGQHDPDYVDAYYGPPEWKAQAADSVCSLAALSEAATALQQHLEAAGRTQFTGPDAQRFRFLATQIRAAGNRISLLAGRAVSFDEESRLLYDAVLPDYPAAHFEAIRARLDQLLPGEGPLPARLERFQQRFVVPREKVEAVMRAAIAECRRRTCAHIALPDSEGFTLELVTGQPWSAYNWYRGNAQSVIQINLDLPFRIETAILLAAHEGYPGHHVQNTLYEREYVRNRGWIEWQVNPLFSPRAVVEEGGADFGIEVVFSPGELVQFGREVLFPLAGFGPAEAPRYYEVHRLVCFGLSPARGDIARRYLDGRLESAKAVELLTTEGLLPHDEALKALEFARHYRAYLMTYDVGYALVKRRIEALGGTPDNPTKRWELFRDLTLTRNTPSELR